MQAGKPAISSNTDSCARHVLKTNKRRMIVDFIGRSKIRCDGKNWLPCCITYGEYTSAKNTNSRYAWRVPLTLRIGDLYWVDLEILGAKSRAGAGADAMAQHGPNVAIKLARYSNASSSTKLGVSVGTKLLHGGLLSFYFGQRIS